MDVDLEVAQESFGSNYTLGSDVMVLLSNKGN
jgi:hypothetical protein